MRQSKTFRSFQSNRFPFFHQRSMSLESTYFQTNFRYKADFVNKCIGIIQEGDVQRSVAYKNLLFRMMKDVVRKNIANYLNLIQSIEKRPENIPTRDEMLAESYLVFDKCVHLFKLEKGMNFYFYFNKSLARTFYLNYQHRLRNCKDTEITDALETVSESFHTKQVGDSTMELLLHGLGFSELESRICKSKLSGQRVQDFLKENTDITGTMYSVAMQRIKSVLIQYKKRGEL